MSSTSTPEAMARAMRAKKLSRTWLIVSLGAIVSISAVRLLTGAPEMNSRGTLSATILATCPILMAAIGGLWSERAGVVNIGLEGQMILGTWGAAYFTYYYGPWVGILGAALLGAVGGALHALATVTFGVDHIVSGVAVNIIGLGAAKYLASAYFENLDGGGANQLTGLDSPTRITVPGVSDASSELATKGWFVISDLAAVVAALTTNMSVMTIFVFALVALTAWLLWKTKFGLRLRSCGENPQAAESLGVNVIRYKWIAVVTSGAFAGIGGGFLALVASSGFVNGQTGGRGYIGLAAMIFGNWRPGGILTGAFLFGYTDSLPLVRNSEGTVHALLLLVAIALLVFAALRLFKKQTTSAGVLAAFGAVFLVWFLSTDGVPRDFTSMTPYVATLLVLAFAAQRLRPPAADGQIYRKGSAG
ncbi:MAG TPA: ABC transporter permease [Nocardioidaceae bacterium]|nr:ABC transporter permease [Nocardioidaceae bacterium]